MGVGARGAGGRSSSLPAYVVSRHNRVLAANPPGRRLLPGLWDWPEEQRNLTRYLFLHPVGRTLYAPWEETVAHSVAHLRAIAGADPADPELTALVGELLLKSKDFARLWERYDVCERGGGRSRTAIRTSAGCTLTYEVMRRARTGGQRMVVYQAAPGIAEEQAMLRLEPAPGRWEAVASAGGPEEPVTEPLVPRPSVATAP
ncbi:MmyB family transcriptional regulator [Streptomyces mexicanus]|uniref:MmyB family transcriptional regulator n=1 Tax=Streptomyces mexicanus TaxID=178566 RepID=UPI002E2D8599|nr:hypothetical protein [Streptomyces mexicanus]